MQNNVSSYDTRNFNILAKVEKNTMDFRPFTQKHFKNWCIKTGFQIRKLSVK